MAELETLDSTECLECSGPPPVFRLPPPPRPPFLTEGTFCSEAPLAELEDCVAIPMIDASYHTNPSLQNTALIITCAVVLLLMAAIVSVVFWKHKRKVQGLLPCKSAAAAAAAAAVAANRRNLGDGHTLQGTTTTGSGLLYEDLPETTPHSQLHNHLSVHNGPPTIEVRGKNAKHHGENVPANHHLDYLDYRDPRYVLRVNEKPSRAVLGGYRTPRALLAKSQGVSQTIATHVPSTPSLITPVIALQLSTHQLSSQSNYNDDFDNSELSSVTGQSYNHQNKRLCTTDSVSLPPTIAYTSVNEIVSPVSSNVITPTHRNRVPTLQLASEKPFTMEQQTNSVYDQRRFRRTSVDSEGYSYVDTDNRYKFDNRIDLTNQGNHHKYEYFDVDGYSYIDTGVRKAPGWAKRVATGDATDDEVCPLCTIQQIHQLLGAPDKPYSNSEKT